MAHPRAWIRLGAFLGLVGALATTFEGSATAQSIDNSTLEAALTRQGFRPPEEFKAWVVRIGDNGQIEQGFDWRGTSDDRDDWWPASSVKLFAAVAALERLNALGFDIRTWSTYHYTDEAGEPDPVRRRFDHIVRLAIQRSDNRAFNQLIELVGMDDLNREFFVPDNGIRNTVFLRHYFGRNPDPETEVTSARPSPRITLVHGSRTRELAARTATGNYACPEEGNCTTLRDLAEVMRRVMVHEDLPEADRYDLTERDLDVLRDALREARNRQLADVFEETCPRFQSWHKPGYALRWMSDTIFLSDRRGEERYVVAIAGRPERRSLDDAGMHIARAICRGALR